MVCRLEKFNLIGHLIEYGYDASGNRTQLKLDNAVFTGYAYDDADRLTTLTDEASQNFTFGYDNADKLISKTMPNNVTTTYNYDGMSRLTELKNQSSTATLTDNNFSYNPASQISQIAELAQTKTFSYDNVNRLTGMTNGTTSESYNFDTVGNRTYSHRSNTYGYQPNNKLVSTQTGSYSYDANGNMKSKSDASGYWIYSWDYENRMTTARNRNKSVRYQYDALGRRVSRLGKGVGTTKYTYDGLDVVLDDGSDGVVKYQNAPGIDNKLKLTSGGISKYFLQDHLGSTVGLTDSSGAVASSASYDSFGNSTNNLTTRFQFTGREKDEFTGLQYNRARWYDSNLGRFISQDPIGFRGGDINLFGYVTNKPLKYIDPRGLDIVIIENGATGGNPFGHTAIGITDVGLITFGNGNPDVPGVNIIGGSFSQYLNNQVSRRRTDLWVIKTTPEQDAAAFQKALQIDYFRPALEQSIILYDNCALRSNEILDAAGIPNNNWFLPNTFPGTAGSRAADYGGDLYVIPQGQSINLIPVYSPDYNWGKFEPRK